MKQENCKIFISYLHCIAEVWDHSKSQFYVPKQKWDSLLKLKTLCLHRKPPVLQNCNEAINYGVQTQNVK